MFLWKKSQNQAVKFTSDAMKAEGVLQIISQTHYLIWTFKCSFSRDQPILKPWDRSQGGKQARKN